MTFIKQNDGQYERWPDNHYDAIEKLASAMAISAIYWRVWEHGLDSTRKAWDTPGSLLQRAIKRILDQLRYGLSDQEAA